MDRWATVRLAACEARTALADVAATTMDGSTLVHVALKRRGVRIYELPSTDAPTADGVVGCIFPTRRLCYVAAWLPRERQAAVLAHELGHLVLHPDDPVRARFSTSRGRTATFEGGYSPEELKERQADVFAAEFLCPATWLRGELALGSRPSDIARRLGIPLELVMAQCSWALVAGAMPGAAAMPDRDAGPRVHPDVERAACWNGGHLIVTGDPGTGKTTALAHRIGWLARTGRPAARILVLASEHNVENVRRRLTPDLALNVRIDTPRAVALDLVRRWPEPLGRTFNPDVLDRVGALETLAQVIRDVKGTSDHATTASAWSAMGIADHRWVDLGVLPNEPPAGAGSDDTFERIRHAYASRLRRLNAYDPHEALPGAVALLRRSPRAQLECRQRFAEVLVDEAEDLAPAAVALLFTLDRLGSRLWISGCDKVASQRFSGARGDALDHLANGLVVDHIRLGTNLRAGNLAPVRSHIKPGQGPAPSRSRRPGTVVDRLPTLKAEADTIARNIEAARRSGIPYGRQAVLVRSHLLLSRLAPHLRESGIPMAHVGDLRSRPEVKALVDLVQGRATKPTGVGCGVAGLLENHLFEGAAEMATLLADDADVETRMTLLALHHLLTICSEHDATPGAAPSDLAGRLAYAGSLRQETGFRRAVLDAADIDAVRLMTIHAAKGLEFAGVHLAGMSEGYMPARRRLRRPRQDWIPPLQHDSDQQDEAALFLIATTRATLRLHVTSATTYARLQTKPSRYIRELK